MIEVASLRKRFGDVVAVDDVSFRAVDGRVTGLLGPNGAGKTTTLRAMTGLLTPDHGTVLVDGIDVHRDRAGAQRRLGVLPDARGLYRRLTARENIRYFGELHGLRGLPLEHAVSRQLDALGMNDLADRRVDGFSQGERAKVALARATVHRPRNVILDEPTNGLDVMSTRAVRDFVRDLRTAGTCVLFSSHIMQEVSALCDEIIVIVGGRVVAHGTEEELRAQTGQERLEDAFVVLSGDAEARG